MKRSLSAVDKVLLLSMLILLAAAGPAWARSYEFIALDMDARLLDDGRLRVDEHRTVRFDGPFSGMFQWIDTSGGITVRDVTVSEGSSEYERNPYPREGPPGTYFVREENQSVYVDWSYAAEDEMRRFTVSYILENAVRLHDDVGELYIQFVGDAWDQRTNTVSVMLHLPEGADASELRAWGHGPLHGNVEIIDGQRIQWRVAPLPANTMLEGRVTFPTHLISNPQYVRTTDEPGLQAILAEEQRWADQANRERLLQQVSWILGVVAVILGLAAGVYVWGRWGREFKPSFDGDYYRELPEPYSPAEMSVLYNNGRTSSRDLTATVLDMARRKWITITETTAEEKRFLRTITKTDYLMSRGEGTETPLAAHETKLLDFLFNEVDQAISGRVSFSDLENFAKKRRRAFAKFWTTWQQTVKQLTQRHGFFDETVKKPRLGALLAAVLVLFVGGAAVAGGFIGAGLGFLVGGFFLLIGAALIYRRSPAGADQFAKWRAFRRFLLHFSEMHRHEIPSLVLWEHFLVYAVSLGVAKQVINQLQIVFPGLEDNGRQFGHGWYYLGARSGMGDFGRSIDQLTSSIQNSFQQSISTATSQSSSGSGSGGGFSGGGGGGVGGGGGGVR